MVKDQLHQDLKSVVEELGYQVGDLVLSISQKKEFGDYSSNIPLQLAKQNLENSNQSASEIANKILAKLQNLEYLEKIEVAGNGFLNFFIKPEFLLKDLNKILDQKVEYGKSEINKDKNARVEFVSANPTGPLHIGNARGGPLGDVISSVLEATGYRVVREYIHNDVGVQVKALGSTVKALCLGESVEDLQYQGDYTKELADQLRGKIEGKSGEEIGQLAVDLLFEEISADIAAMGIKFDLIVKESELRQKAGEVIDQLKQAGVVKEKDGALWLAPSDEFLEDRETVIQKSDGNYTYFTSDIVYHQQKFESNADLIIDIFGSNHHGHVPRLQAAMAALGFDISRLKFILYQYVRVKRGSEILKMSKRAGTFITAREVLDEVGVDAFRFSLLRFAAQTHIDFDLELYKKQSNDNPVFYVQYAHARMSSILEKSGEVVDGKFEGWQPEEVELNLIKHLLELPGLVEDVSKSLMPHHLVEYTISLADKFHKFYENCPVLNTEDDKLKSARLSLVKAAQITLSNSLGLLGVQAPEKM